MKYPILAVMAVGVITASVKAELGVTQHEFDPRTPADYVYQGNGGIWMRWVGYKNNPVLHAKVTQEGFFVNGLVVAEKFWFNDHRPMSSKEIEYFLEPYKWFKRSAQDSSDDGTMTGVTLLDSSGRPYAAAGYDKQTHVLNVVSAAELAKVTPRPQPQQQAQPRRTPDENDCEVIASNKYHDLKDHGMPWVNIVRFQYIWRDQPTAHFGHAMTAWQIERGGKVQVYDKEGTLELNTRSTDLTDIINALEPALARRYDRWISLFNGNFAVTAEPEPTSTPKVAEQEPLPYHVYGDEPAPEPQPSVAPTVAIMRSVEPAKPNKPTPVDMVAGIIVLLLALGIYAMLPITLGLKGKNTLCVISILCLFAHAIPGLLIIGAAIRVAKPESWWAKKYYHGNQAFKMELAYQRFGGRPKPPPLPATAAVNT